MASKNEKATKSTGKTIIIVLLIIVILGLIDYICYDKGLIFNNKESINDKENNTPDTNENNNEISNLLTKINKRLYSVNSDLHQQRYYLLIDDATYDINQDFLNKKTYILDMNMVEGNEIVKEINLRTRLKPFVDNYISSHKGFNTGTCTIEYFSATNGVIPPPIDYDKEVAFIGYYRCVDNNVETSIGSKLYSYNVETDTITDLGTSY